MAGLPSEKAGMNEKPLLVTLAFILKFSSDWVAGAGLMAVVSPVVCEKERCAAVNNQPTNPALL